MQQLKRIGIAISIVKYYVIYAPTNHPSDCENSASTVPKLIKASKAATNSKGTCPTGKREQSGIKDYA